MDSVLTQTGFSHLLELLFLPTFPTSLRRGRQPPLSQLSPRPRAQLAESSRIEVATSSPLESGVLKLYRKPVARKRFERQSKVRRDLLHTRPPFGEGLNQRRAQVSRERFSARGCDGM